jgi:serine/threonine protein kinase
MIALEGRYQLTAPHPDGQGATRWTAKDSVLGLTVDVLTLPDDDPRAARLVAATRAAGAVGDPRLQHVVDVGVATTQEGEVAYVVHRRPPGEPLSKRLSSGPMDPTRAAAVIADAAAALGAAHRSGLGHGGITPDAIVVDDDSTSVNGLGVVAALTGRPTSVLGDTRALAAVLYAALTARAATSEVPGLTLAPVTEGRPVRPRLVRAGIPGRLDDITARALALPGAEPTIDDPDHLAAELRQYLTAVREQRLRHDHRVPTAPDWPWSRLAAIGAVTLILIGAGLAGWQAWSEARSRTPEEAGPTPTSSASATRPVTPTPVTVARVRVLDPQGNGVENNDQAALAVDGDPTTSWTTLNYASRDLGGLKGGVGLELDLGGLTTVSSVQLQLVGRGTDVTVYTTKSAASSAGTRGLSGFRPLVALRGLGDQVTIPLSPAITSRALVIWLTGLPSNGTSYTGGVAEVVVTS